LKQSKANKDLFGSEYPAQTSAFTDILFLRFFLPVPSDFTLGLFAFKSASLTILSASSRIKM